MYTLSPIKQEHNCRSLSMRCTELSSKDDGKSERRTLQQRGLTSTTLDQMIKVNISSDVILVVCVLAMMRYFTFVIAMSSTAWFWKPNLGDKKIKDEHTDAHMEKLGSSGPCLL